MWSAVHDKPDADLTPVSFSDVLELLYCGPNYSVSLKTVRTTGGFFVFELFLSTLCLLGGGGGGLVFGGRENIVASWKITQPFTVLCTY